MIFKIPNVLLINVILSIWWFLESFISNDFNMIFKLQIIYVHSVVDWTATTTLQHSKSFFKNKISMIIYAAISLLLHIWRKKCPETSLIYFFQQILILTNKEYCLSFQKICFRESCCIGKLLQRSSSE